MVGVVTERDEEWLRWMVRWKGVTARQVARWFVPDAVGGRQAVERRFRVWRELELVEGQRFMADTGSVYWVTAEGMKFLGVEGTVSKPSAGQLRHDLAVTDCATWLRATTGARMVTEREVRRMEPPRSQDRRFAVTPVEGTGRVILYPDLLTRSATGEVVSHEVELAPKAGPRLRALMLSNARARHLSATVYYAPEATRKRVQQCADEVNQRMRLDGVADKISVRAWEWEREGA